MFGMVETTTGSVGIDQCFTCPTHVIDGEFIIDPVDEPEEESEV